MRNYTFQKKLFPFSFRDRNNGEINGSSRLAYQLLTMIGSEAFPFSDRTKCVDASVMNGLQLTPQPQTITMIYNDLAQISWKEKP